MLDLIVRWLLNQQLHTKLIIAMIRRGDIDEAVLELTKLHDNIGEACSIKAED